MKKSTYLIVLFLISFGYFSFLYKDPLIIDITTVLSWLWGGVGLIVYRSSFRNILNTYAHKKYVYWFIGIMFISTLYPYVEFNQPILNTLIAQRANYSIFFLIIFLKICPTQNDFFIALRFCTILTILISIVSIFFPDFFLTQEKFESLQIRQNKGSTDIITFGGGLPLFYMYFLITLNKLYNNVNRKLLLEVLILFIMLILFQNRSRLLISIPFFLYVIVSMRSKYKGMYWFLVLLLTSFSFYYLFSIFVNIFDETLEQINNPDYNRWQAIDFYLFEFKSNFFTILFGHGSPAAGSTYLDLLQNIMRTRLAILSDIGMLGSYFYYGLFFVVIIYSFCIKSFKKYQPLYLKLFAIFIICVPTIQGFGNNSLSAAIYFSMFFYLILYHRQSHKLKIYNQIKNA